MLEYDHGEGFKTEETKEALSSNIHFTQGTAEMVTQLDDEFQVIVENN